MKFRKLQLFLILAVSSLVLGGCASGGLGLSSMAPLPAQALTTTNSAIPLQTRNGQPTISFPISGVSISRNGKHTDCSVVGKCLHNHRDYEGAVVYIDDNNFRRIGQGVIRNGVVTAKLKPGYSKMVNRRLNISNVYIGGKGGQPIGYLHLSCGIEEDVVETHACPIVTASQAN